MSVIYASVINIINVYATFYQNIKFDEIMLISSSDIAATDTV